MIYRQRRDDWTTYDSAETAEPQIIAWMNNDYVFLVTWDSASTELVVSDSIAMPCNTDQLGAGCTDRAFITLAPEWIDIGYNYLAVLSPIDCAAVYESTTITNASVRYYRLDTVWDVDSDFNGWVDSSEGADNNADGVIDDLDYTAVDYTLGWTCNDLPTSLNWQQETTVYWEGKW